jgi:hypothetical protein
MQPMEKFVNILLLILIVQSAANAQCGINYREILAHSCQGEYLQHQELNQETGARVSMILEKGNRYAIYLLNPNLTIPELKFGGDAESLFKDYQSEYNQEEKTEVHLFTARETGDYYFSLDFGTEEKACILMAIYLQHALKAGIYKDFEEFRQNDPSVEFNIQVSRKLRKYGDIRSRGRITYYRLDIDKAKGRSIGKVFGFSDGEHVYINERHPDLGPGTEFIRIEDLGRYCYFEDRKPTTIFIGTVPTTIYSLERKIMDASTGEIMTLSKKRLEKIITDNNELHAEFQHDPENSKKLKEYLIRYLEE